MPLDYDSMAEATPDNTSTNESPHHYSEEKNPINDMLQHGTHPMAGDEDENDYPTSLKLVSVVVALVLAVFLASLDMNIIATAIPRITDEFHSLDQVKSMVSEQISNCPLTSSRLAGTALPCS